MATEKEALERVARMYKTSKDASQALGITLRSFGRLCKKYNIETPYSRRLRSLQTYRNPT